MLSHLTDTLTILIQNLYISTGLLGIVIAMAIESCCIPLPSEIVMPLAGIMIASGKLLHGTSTIAALLLVALSGAVGCLLGSIVAYTIGYGGGRPLMLKYGRYVLISQHDADLADRFFQRWGSATAFFSRLLPVVRTYISLPAGISKMPFVKFCVYSVLGSFPWCFVLAFVGVQLGNHLDKLSPIFHSLDVVILVVVVALVALYIWRHIRNDKKARAEAAAAEVNQSAMANQPWSQQANQSVQQPWNQQAAMGQNWNQQANQLGQQPWNQPQSSMPVQGQNGWNAPSSPTPPPSQFQPPSQFRPMPQSQPAQGWNQPQPQWGQGQPPTPSQNWGQQNQQSQPNWPPQADDDRTIYRR